MSTPLFTHLFTRVSHASVHICHTYVDPLVHTFSGVERVFSAAGKMHDDLRKSEKDSTLEHSLFAAFNVE